MFFVLNSGMVYRFSRLKPSHGPFIGLTLVRAQLENNSIMQSITLPLPKLKSVRDDRVATPKAWFGNDNFTLVAVGHFFPMIKLIVLLLGEYVPRFHWSGLLRNACRYLRHYRSIGKILICYATGNFVNTTFNANLTIGSVPVKQQGSVRILILKKTKLESHSF